VVARKKEGRRAPGGKLNDKKRCRMSSAWDSVNVFVTKKKGKKRLGGGERKDRGSAEQLIKTTMIGEERCEIKKEWEIRS